MKRFLVTYWVKRTKFGNMPDGYPSDCVITTLKNEEELDALDILGEVAKKLGDMYDTDCLVLINYWRLK